MALVSRVALICVFLDRRAEELLCESGDEDERVADVGVSRGQRPLPLHCEFFMLKSYKALWISCFHVMFMGNSIGFKCTEWWEKTCMCRWEIQLMIFLLNIRRLQRNMQR